MNRETDESIIHKYYSNNGIRKEAIIALESPELCLEKGQTLPILAAETGY